VESVRPPVSDQLIEAIRVKAPIIDQTPYGRLTADWQDGKLVWSETTIKDKHGGPPLLAQPHK
jgi:hypothetical protein